MNYDVKGTEDIHPAEARRPFAIAMTECQDQLAKLAALIREVEERAVALRLSVPRPEEAEKTVKAARDMHSPAVDGLLDLREHVQSLQRRLVVLLEELEV